jgi:hypothetical protein
MQYIGARSQAGADPGGDSPGNKYEHTVYKLDIFSLLIIFLLDMMPVHNPMVFQFEVCDSFP